MTPEPEEIPPDHVPLFGTWRKAYVAIVIAFVVQVAIFYALGRYFS